MDFFRKQSLIGIMLGMIAFTVIWFSLSAKRLHFKELIKSNDQLTIEVKKVTQFKDNFEKLKIEIEEQEMRIAELVQLFASTNERIKITHMVQKLASISGLGQFQEQKNIDNPIRNDYYFDYSSIFKYIGSFHEFGRFLSLISGYEKIINISDIVMTRNAAKNATPVSIEFRLSVYVYDPSTDTSVAAARFANSEDKP